MSWIESHQSLGRHPKLIRLAARLGVSRRDAVGLLHYLWWWAVDYAQDGDLSETTNEELSAASDWDGDSSKLRECLLACGFLDENGMLHDWNDYAGRLIEQRRNQKERTRERVREYRSKYGNGDSNASVTPLHGPSNGGTVPTNQTSTRPTQTVPDQPNQNSKTLRAPKLGALVSEEKEKLFQRFWDAYPRHENKKRARELFLKLNPPVVDVIFQALEVQKKSESWTKDGGKFIPHATTWLNGRRWEDEPLVSSQSPSENPGTKGQRNPGVTGFRSAREILEGLGAAV